MKYSGLIKFFLVACTSLSYSPFAFSDQKISSDSSIPVKSEQCCSTSSSLVYNSLNFVYESGIESMNFVYNGSYALTTNGGATFNSVATSTATFSTKPYNNQSGYVITVSYYNNAGNSEAIADSFTTMFDNNIDYIFSVSMSSKLDQLKFWVQGTLTINGNQIAPDFTLAYKDLHSDNWWIASMFGNTIVENNQRVRGLQFRDKNNNFYCLTNDGLYGNPYNFIEVHLGTCPYIN